MQDGGDGSQSTILFNNKDELAEYLKHVYNAPTIEEIESEDDPYNNGYLVNGHLNLAVDDDGNIKLADRFYTSCG